jgi:4,5-dihydroxyphthalate decarboxylase
VSRLQGNNAALKRGDIRPEGFSLEFEEVPVLVQAFRRMVRQLEFDVCEMAITTYMCAREHGVKFTALPIFLVRGFHHGAILQNVKSRITDPVELEGQRVGVNRGYTVTTGVWARSILQVEYGVDLGKVTWVLSGDEHVEAYRPPPNVVASASELSIEKQLEKGELAAAINISTDSSLIEPMISEPIEAGIRAFQDRGHYPINHLVVVKDEILARYPHAAAAVFNAFAASKEIYLNRLRNGEIDKLDEADRVHLRIMELGGSPLPYGIEPNRRVIEELIRHALTQKILSRPVEVDSLFADSTKSLIG